MNLVTTTTVYTITEHVLQVTRELLVEAGRRGFESAVLWAGTVDADGLAHVTQVYRPEQRAVKAPLGLAVELTEAGLTQLIGSLDGDELVLARLHAHGNDDVRHSPVDDKNLVIGHPGAISIVVPRFALAPITLASCGVHLLDDRHRWRRLTARETAQRLQLR